ncbi:hypothetical protein GCM10010330_56930 [Streptomyces tendae]|uniref:hypothetical protein n=1 Tax=Streptomyces tendae TaxID=1932 RepID=UPI001677C7E3|nr:hypothetical protein [Streptomyces tendae]GHA95388.1 hypothetical protein GCM10010330_56930 [Streptomyces tendae]
MERTDQQQPQPSPTPVTQDANASAAELQQRAAADLAATRAAAQRKADTDGTEVREGVLPGGAA